MGKRTRQYAVVVGGLAALMSVSSSVGEDQPAAEELERPKYQWLRWQEDWSVLRDVPREQLTDFWDPIKYVPLNDDGSIWASFGGSTRARVESWWNFGFGDSPAADDTFVLWYAMVHGDFHFGENVRAFVQGKSSLSTPRTLAGGTRPLDVDTLALEAAFVDLKVDLGDAATLVVRPGRQSFLFGKQRLVSPLPWSNTFRRWDGVDFILDVGGWNIHGFWSRFVPVKKYEFNTSAQENQFYGIYATGPLADTGIGLDAYFLGLENQDPRTFNGTSGPERRYTIGGRLFGDIGDTRLDYDFEGAYQFGQVGTGDVSAFMIGSQLGYRVPDWWSSPRFFVGFDYGSGDRALGGDVQTFNHLYPLGHKYLGFIDIVGRQNIIDFNLGVTGKPNAKTTVGIFGHFFWRPEAADALYNAGGGVVRPGAPGTSSEVGQEIDLTVLYRFNRHLTGRIGYSHFFAGSFISDTGPPVNDIDFLYAEMTYTF
ncbi:MAG: alginate export family protein [Planctomycetota bacterium]|jgi:hypothetical protein